MDHVIDAMSRVVVHLTTACHLNVLLLIRR